MVNCIKGFLQIKKISTTKFHMHPEIYMTAYALISQRLLRKQKDQILAYNLMGYQMSPFYEEGSPYQLSVYQGKFHFQESSSLLLTMVVQCASQGL